MDSDKLVQECIAICEDRKAVNVMVFDVRGSSTIADYYLFCSGNSEIHLRAIANNLTRGLKDKLGILPRSVEGTPASRWILVDFADVLAHIFHPETREHYDIESLYQDSPRIYPPD